MTGKLFVPLGSLEESVLRILYEGPASASDCVSELARYSSMGPDFAGEVELTLRDLANRACVALEMHGGTMRYVLCPRGSERLAQLVERSENAPV